MDSSQEHRLSAQDRAILGYTERLTLKPASITEQDIGRLREQGLSDHAILDVCQIVGYFSYVNRLADGLGVSLEENPPI